MTSVPTVASMVMSTNVGRQEDGPGLQARLSGGEAARMNHDIDRKQDLRSRCSPHPVRRVESELELWPRCLAGIWHAVAVLIHAGPRRDVGRVRDAVEVAVVGESRGAEQQEQNGEPERESGHGRTFRVRDQERARTGSADYLSGG
jgi:hypothetical protein